MMSWQETVLAAIAIIGGMALIGFALAHVSRIIQAIATNAREKRYQELSAEIVTTQHRMQTQLDDIQLKVTETERRIREVD